ncbi:MAG: alpha/beta hydrolase, partial [Acidimicrobiales bacterium]
MRKAVPGGLVVLVALLSACSPSGGARTATTVVATVPPVSTTSTTAPTTTTTVALPPVTPVQWSACGALQCGTVAVPLDYADPAMGTIQIALARH